MREKCKDRMKTLPEILQTETFDNYYKSNETILYDDILLYNHFEFNEALVSKSYILRIIA